MPTAHIVHGFNVFDDGKETIDRLIPHLEKHGFDIIEHDYGWRFFLGVRFLNQWTANKIADIVQEGDIGVGHSNGCDILYRASIDCEFAGLVFINPALDSDTGPLSDWTHVYYNEDDSATETAKWIPFHNWGAQGNTGYTGEDQTVTNYSEKYTVGLPSISGHSTVFKSPEWCEFIAINTRRAWDEWDEDFL